MIKIINCNDFPDVESAVNTLNNRNIDNAGNVDEIVAKILENVKSNGDKTLFEYTEQFDKAKLDVLEVTESEIEEAFNATDDEFLEILKEAKENITKFHEKQKRSGYMMTEQDGVVLGQKITPLDRVGIYVPGGTALYPSTVLMDTIPAKIAGVGEIIMVTPPGRDGKISNDILAAASIAGVDRIFKVGGAQAIAALAFGTQSIPKVNKIVGPGNIYVATAKRMVYGVVAIDMIAGPSEILVIADKNANPDYIAVDLLSQAEHDKLAASFLVTDCKELANEVAKKLEIHIKTLPREEIARASIDNYGAIFITDSIKSAIEISNEIAPEHLEVCTADPFSLLSEIKHAGSIFLGANAPEALGDYFAGPNHTLPTNGTAKFSSALSVDDFIKKSSIIYYNSEALSKVGEKVATFAKREGLHAHARSVTIRLEDMEN